MNFYIKALIVNLNGRIRLEFLLERFKAVLLLLCKKAKKKQYEHGDAKKKNAGQKT